MKYQVILLLDVAKNKKYYQSYVESNDSTLGNIECSDLPAYQDINKAQACYWDSDNKSWVYDDEKYNEIRAKKDEEKEEADRIASIPSNEELKKGLDAVMDAVCELAQLYDNSIEPLSDLASLLK